MTILGGGELLQHLLKIAVGRDHNETMLYGVFENPSVTNLGKPISERTLRFREYIEQ